ncbi:MAG: hypothetical protein PUP90_03240 [Nostoc sp. S4]|nr:hypothetical protein [Nostoc sp. S4]
MSLKLACIIPTGLVKARFMISESDRFLHRYQQIFLIVEKSDRTAIAFLNWDISFEIILHQGATISQCI